MTFFWGPGLGHGVESRLLHRGRDGAPSAKDKTIDLRS